MEALIVLCIGGLAGAGLYLLAEQTNQQEREAYIEAVGGPDSPWLDRPAHTQPPGEAKRVYPASHQVPPVPEPASAPTSAPVSAASPPAPPYEPLPTVPPGFHRSPLPTGDTVEVVPTVAAVAQGVGLIGDSWLEANQCFFPVAVPVEEPVSYAERTTLNLALDWISQAKEAGVSQTKVATVMFDTTKNSKAYKRVVAIYKGL